MKTYAQAMADARALYLRQALKRAGNCVKKAAEMADLNRTAFYEILARAGIEPPSMGHSLRVKRGITDERLTARRIARCSP